MAESSATRQVTHRTIVEAEILPARKMRHRAAVSNVQFLGDAMRTRAEVETEGGVDGALARLDEREFVFYSDEPEYLGGDDAYPAPLEYFASALGMCLTTQLVRFAKALRVTLTSLRVAVRLTWEREGSALAGTLSVRCTDALARIELESPDDRDRIERLIRTARSGCFVEAALRQPVNVRAEVVLNGNPDTDAS